MENTTGSQSDLFWLVWLHLLMEFIRWEPEEVKGAVLALGASANVAMYVAIKLGDKELLEAALAEGANLHWLVNAPPIVFKRLLLALETEVGILGTILDHIRADQREALCKYLLLGMRCEWRWNSRVKVVQMILDKSDVIDSVDENGRTALMHASFYNNALEAVDFFLKSGANPDIRDREGRTALHHAAKSGANLVVKALLEAGASPWIADNYGLPPIEVAKFKNTNKMLASAMKHKAPKDL